MKPIRTVTTGRVGARVVRVLLIVTLFSATANAQTITLGEAVDDTSLTWTTGGDADWFGQTSVYYHDGDAAQSGDLAASDQSSWIETTVTGPGELSFYWKISSIYSTTNLNFEIDGVEESLCWEYEGWDRETFILPVGSHTLRWNFTRGYYSGEAGYLDRVEYIGIETVPLDEALDNTFLTWITGGDAEWFGQTSVYHYDDDAAQSGNLTCCGEKSSWIQTTVTGPGGLSFYWKVSSLSSVTDLKFEIDGIEETICWEYEGWELKTFSIPAGSHTLRWNFAPVIPRSGEAGYLDKVTYVDELAVLIPNGGETWNHREIYTIVWRDPENVDTSMKLGLFKGGSLIHTISASTDNDGDYSWLIPARLEQGSDHQIKLSSVSNPSIYDYSDLFSIAESSQTPFGGLLVLDKDSFAEADDHFELDVGDEIGESITIEAWVYLQGPADLLWPGISRDIVKKHESYWLYGRRYDEPDIPLWKHYGCFGLGLTKPSGSPSNLEYCKSPHSYWFKWHHVAGVFNEESGDMRIYLDGILLAESTGFESTLKNSIEKLIVGEDLTGFVDEIRISDVPRYTGSNFSVPTSPFTCDEHTRALWHFDEFEGATTFHDSCGADNLLIGHNGAHTEGGTVEIVEQHRLYLPLILRDYQ